VPVAFIIVVSILALTLGIRASWVWFMRERADVTRARRTAGSVAIGLLLLNCCYFALLLCKGQIGGFGTHYITTRMVDWYLLGSMGVTATSWLTKGESRREALIAGALATVLWFGSELVA
jgi:hypothetical protein